jgi:LPXTG-motif cell wall-anchored protein
MQFLKRSTPRVLVAASLMAGLVATVAGPVAAQEPPTFTIIKDTRPDQSQDFTFTATGPIPAQLGDGIFQLDDDGSELNGLPSVATFPLPPNPEGSGLDPYVITEEQVDGFELTDIECTLNGEPQDLDDIAVLNDEDELIGITGRLDLDDAAVCTFVNEEADGDSDPYDTYGDDPGDPDFDFETPFQNADSDPDVVQVAGTSLPAVTQQPEAAAVVLNDTAPATPQGDIAPVALTELPRTGSGARQTTMVGGLLLALGGIATLAGRRREANQA